MKLALDCSFIGFVTNEARNKLANPLCPKYSGTVCSLILSPKDLSKGHKLKKVKMNLLYNQDTIMKAFICYKEAVVNEWMALEQVLLCSKGKSTVRCRTEKWNPAGEAVFGAKRNQHLCRNASRLLENGKGVWCWAAEGVSVALGQTEEACGLQSSDPGSGTAPWNDIPMRLPCRKGTQMWSFCPLCNTDWE